MPKSSPNIHFLKSGNHTDTHGVAVEFSEQDMAATVAAYDPAKHEAPLVIGHPKLNAPAYGWVKALRMADDGPEAIPHQVHPEFAEMREAGSFKKVSASFYPPESPANPVPGVFYLRHIGFLGAQPPAIKGLREPQFSEDESAEDFITIEFSEPEQPPEEDTTVTPEEAAALKAQNDKLTADLAARDKLLADERTARAKENADRAHADNVSFAEKLATETRIGKDDVPLVASVLTQLQQPAGDAAKPVEFGEGDESLPMHQVLTDWLTKLPERVEFGEHATKDKAAGADDGDADEVVEYAEGTDPDAIALDKKIRAHMKKHKTDYRTAADAVANQ